MQFKLLHSMFHLCSNTTKYILLSTYIKLINLFPEIKLDIEEVLVNLTLLLLNTHECHYIEFLIAKM